jgi:pilus assembly protein CpaE
MGLGKMSDQVTVVMIDADDNSRRYMKAMLSEIPWIKVSAEATELNRGYELVRQYQPTIVILDLFPSVDHGLKLAEKITQNIPKSILIVTHTENKQEVVIRAMRSGAREFLTKPLNKEEVLNAVRGVIRLKKYSMLDGDSTAKIITLFGVKGGVGTTTIATNLAVNLSNHAKGSVVLVDLNLQLGNAALFMNMNSSNTIVDIAKNIDDLNPKLLKKLLPRHSSGIYLLTSSSRMEEAESIRTTHLDQLLTLLRSTFEYIVIDANDVLDEITLKVLDDADSILTVSTVDIPAIYNTRQCLDVFQRMGYGKDKVQLVINRYASKSKDAFKELEKSLDYPIFWRIPNQDYKTVVNSINEGVPVSIMKPKSPLSQSFKELSAHYNGKISEKSGKADGKLKRNFIGKLFTHETRRS